MPPTFALESEDSMKLITFHYIVRNKIFSILYTQILCSCFMFCASSSDDKNIFTCLCLTSSTYFELNSPTVNTEDWLSLLSLFILKRKRGTIYNHNSAKEISVYTVSYSMNKVVEFKFLSTYSRDGCFRNTKASCAL